MCLEAELVYKIADNMTVCRRVNERCVGLHGKCATDECSNDCECTADITVNLNRPFTK